MSSLPDGLCREVARTVYESVFPIISDGRTSLFLMGASVHNAKSLRALLNEVFSKPPLSLRYKIIYPEDLFDELIYQQGYNLMELENLLARSVQGVVICPESPGSYAELGAFSNHSELSKRVIIVSRKKYRSTNSFITKGPIRYIKKLTGSVIWYDEAKGGITAVVDQVRKALRSRPVPAPSIGNPVSADNFVLPFLYVAGPMTRKDLERAVRLIVPDAGEEAAIACSAALAVLFKQRAVRLESGAYSVTPSGLQRMWPSTARKRQTVRILLDHLRVEVLNSRLRRS